MGVVTCNYTVSESPWAWRQVDHTVPERPGASEHVKYINVSHGPGASVHVITGFLKCQGLWDI